MGNCMDRFRRRGEKKSTNSIEEAPGDVENPGTTTPGTANVIVDAPSSSTNDLMVVDFSDEDNGSESSFKPVVPPPPTPAKKVPTANFKNMGDLYDRPDCDRVMDLILEARMKRQQKETNTCTTVVPVAVEAKKVEVVDIEEVKGAAALPIAKK